MSSLVWSTKFFSLYVNRLCCSYNQVYFGEATKLVGLHLLKNDSLITKFMLFAVGTSLAFRMTLNWLFEKLDLHKFVYLNCFFNLMTSLSILVFGAGEFGFFMFSNLQRIGSGNVIYLQARFQ